MTTIHDYIKQKINPALITFLLSTFLLCSNANALEPLDSIAVVVNDDVITKRELEEKVDYFANQIRLSNGSVSDMDSLRKQVLERMIRDKIQLQQAAQLGIQVDDINLNRMIDAMAKKNNLTLNELRTTLTKEGIDFADFRSQTRDELIIQELQKRMVAEKVNVTSQEIRQFIESNTQQDNSATEYHLYHILIATP
ncbi:MAG: SurA N-terminal domain-containing protein, partial [Gammaproteobacteria bacterium]